MILQKKSLQKMIPIIFPAILTISSSAYADSYSPDVLIDQTKDGFHIEDGMRIQKNGTQSLWVPNSNWRNTSTMIQISNLEGFTGDSPVIAGHYFIKEPKAKSPLSFHISISNAEIYSLYGSYSPETDDDCSNNYVQIGENCSVAQVLYGGYATNGGKASGNTLEISGDNFEKTRIRGGYSTKSDACNNEIIIHSGTFNNRIYGGYSPNGTATGNIITVKGGILGPELLLIGGYANSSSKKNSFQGNTLNLYVPIAVKEISAFQFYNFYIPKTASSGDVMIQVCGEDPTDISGLNEENQTYVRAGVMAGSSLKKGDSITLIKNTNGIIAKNVTYGTLTEGVSIDYPLDISLTDNNTALTAVISNAPSPPSKNNPMQDPPDPKPAPPQTPPSNPSKKSSQTNSKTDISKKKQILQKPQIPIKLKEETKSLTETRAAGIGLLNSSSNLLATQSTANAEEATGNSSNTNPSEGTYSPFAAIGGNNMRYNSGSHIDTKGLSGTLGFARKLHYKNSNLLLAPFLEYGRANYDSYLDDGTHGTGAQQCFGIGFLAKKSFVSGDYYEGSLRIGKLKGNYSGILDKIATSYDTESNYLGIHAGAGKIFKLSERSHLDTYGKFFYTLQGQDSPHLSSGETYQFDAVRSCRLRLGTKLTQDIAENQQLYAGVAWDYEFDSEASATYRGLSTPSPSLKGGSFLWEIGWKQKDNAENHLAADLGITCWRGKQEGIDLHASFLWNY